MFSVKYDFSLPIMWETKVTWVSICYKPITTEPQQQE